MGGCLVAGGDFAKGMYLELGDRWRFKFRFRFRLESYVQ